MRILVGRSFLPNAGIRPAAITAIIEPNVSGAISAIFRRFTSHREFTRCHLTYNEFRLFHTPHEPVRTL